MAVGIGGAGLLAGMVNGLAALAAESSLLERCPDRTCPRDAWDDADAYDSMRAASTVGFVVGTIGLAAGIPLLVLSSKAKRDAAAPDAGARRTPHFGAWIGAGTASVRGAF